MLTHVSTRLPSPFRTRERKLFRAAISLLEYLQHVLHRRFSSFSMNREQKVVRRLIESIRFSIAHSLFHSLFFTCFLFLPSFLTTNELGVLFISEKLRETCTPPATFLPSFVRSNPPRRKPSPRGKFLSLPGPCLVKSFSHVPPFFPPGGLVQRCSSSWQLYGPFPQNSRGVGKSGPR